MLEEGKPAGMSVGWGEKKGRKKSCCSQPGFCLLFWKETCQNVHELLINTVNNLISVWTRCCLEKPFGRLPPECWTRVFPLNSPACAPQARFRRDPRLGGLWSRYVGPPEEHICYGSLSLRFSTIEQLFHTLPPLFTTHGRQGDLSNERLKGSSLITSTNTAIVVTVLQPSVTVRLSALKIS